MPNVIVTPHVAGARPRCLELVLELFIDSLTRYVSGNALLNASTPSPAEGLNKLN
jgi:phosphoglycerate dehydrogenase-like enzyme